MVAPDGEEYLYLLCFRPKILLRFVEGNSIFGN